MHAIGPHRGHGRSLTRNTAAAIYGTVVTAALIAGDSIETTDTALIVTTVVVVVPLYWLAHAYAEFLAHGIHEETAPKVVATLRQEIGIIWSALPLLATILVLRSVGVDENTAVNVALWLAVVELVAVAIVAARHNRLRGFALVAAVAVSALFGVVIVVLKAVMH
ncbi:MAG TPA: hypothetical protein VFW74_08505 [Acidimicrobiia bacterium]|nr:hypothetical protein [Acidimicrobiia bacterium]